MEIVIDIDENVFTRLFDNGMENYEIVNDDLFAIAKSIRNGTPLPKQQPCEDCISRSKALEMLGDEPENWTDTEKEIQEVNDYRWFKSILESLPSVTPKADVLDEIRAKIENHCGYIEESHCRYCYHCNNVMGVREILKIFDKYKEGEDKE